MADLPLVTPDTTAGVERVCGGVWVPASAQYIVAVQGAISVDDARADDVRKLLAAHLAFANEHSPPEDVHALDVGDLLDPGVTVFSFRLNGQLLGVGALKRLDAHHAELKSIHTDATSRRRGVG